MFKVIPLLILLSVLIGCNKTWQEIDLYAKQIKCTDSQDILAKRAKSFGADVVYVAESQSLQVGKSAETVVIQFDNQSRITRVSVFKVELKLLGLIRRQVTPFTLLDCTIKESID